MVSTDPVPTMRDVAAAAGVSKALVSIVFREVPGASEQTRAHVLQVAEKLGYRPNRGAQLLSLRRTRHLGVTLNLNNAFHAELAAGIQAAADTAGYQVVLGAVTEHRDETRAVQSLLEFRCEALILLGSEQTPAQLRQLAASAPLVLIGRSVDLPGVDTVTGGDARGLELLVDHLADLGHHDIAHVDGGPGAVPTDRRRGYRTAMRRHHLDHHIRVISGGRSEEAGWRAAEELLRAPALPTAITAFNDHCALGVIGRLTREGLTVPGDVSVTGYDNTPVSHYSVVDLTTVSHEPDTQALEATHAAIRRLDGPADTPRSDYVALPRLVTRGSTTPPAVTGSCYRTPQADPRNAT